MKKAAKLGVRVPDIIKMDIDKKQIVMEYLEDCKTLREMMKGLDTKIELKERDTTRKQKGELSQLEFAFMETGKMVSLMHSNGIIHGDLTSSNIMVKNDWSDIILIDFGLSAVR